MKGEKITKFAFFISFSLHILFLGLPLNFPKTKEPKDIKVQIEIEKPTVHKISEKKKIKKELKTHKYEKLKKVEKKIVKKVKPIKKLPKKKPIKKLSKKKIEPKEKLIEDIKPIEEKNIKPIEEKKLPEKNIKEDIKKTVKEMEPEKGMIIDKSSLTYKSKKEISKNSEGTVKKGKSIKNIIVHYMEIVRNKIEEKKSYPALARRKGIEGKVYIKFTVLSTGYVDKIEIIKSSGSKILDKSAIRTLKKASPFPPLPEEIDTSSIQMEVVLVYNLKENR